MNYGMLTPFDDPEGFGLSPEPEEEEPMAPTKLCLFCEHCWWDSGEEYFSEETPGSSPSLECLKKHFEDGLNKYPKESLARLLLQAKDCIDFEWSQAIREETS